LIVLKEYASSEAKERILSSVKTINGKADIIFNDGKVIIATFNNVCVEKIRQIPCVKLVGVTVRRRKLPHNKVYE